MMTRNGIIYDLTKSPYKVKENNICFVFSSQSHKNKFIERLEENRDIINYSLTKRFGFKIKVNKLADIVLYKKIESRGFLIESDGDNICLKSLILNGDKLTMMNCHEK